MNNSTIKNFDAVPRTKRPRSRFTPAASVKTSFNAGKLIPVAVMELLPNTTIKLDLSTVCRGVTPLAPVLDNAYLDVFAFWVPNRLSWQHWEDFLSEPKPEAYESAPQYVVPHLYYSLGSNAAQNQYGSRVAGTFWDYAGVGAASASQVLGGTSVSESGFPSLNALYPRGYVRIWNEWFRDQNVQDFAHCYTDDVDRAIPPEYTAQSDPLITAEYGAALLPVSKYKDYFTSALPQAQKGPPVGISLGDLAPVVPNLDSGLVSQQAGSVWLPLNNLPNANALFSPRLYESTGGAIQGSFALGASGNSLQRGTASTSFAGGQMYMAEGINVENGSVPALYADLSSAQAVTVNALRLAFQTQRFQEKLARSGSRYTELLRSMFSVYASDSRLQRSEYLGGRRFPITQHQVAQTAENAGSGGQSIGLGDTGAFVFASDSSHLIHKSFPEHGILYILCCVRTDQTYCQGVPVQFTRRNRFDYYFPVFAHIGEQPIRRFELYATNTPDDNNMTFGYKEPWVEYKYMKNHVTAKMRPYVDGNFGIWSYANNFQSPPVLSPSFIVQDVANIDRTLAVSSQVQDQFFADFYFKFRALDLPMPLFNTPGLIDHD